MRRLLAILILAPISVFASGLGLDEVLRASQEKAGGGDASLEVAKARLGLLQAMSKRRPELRPQIGLFSLTNPLSLAASLGLGLLGRPDAPPPTTMIDAEIDVLGAEIAGARFRFEREVETTRRFYDVLAHQEEYLRTCQVAEDREGAALGRKLSAGQVTQLEVLRHEQELLERREACRGREFDLRLAAGRLSALTGIDPESLRVSDSAAPPPEPEVAPVSYLISTAIQARREPRGFRERIEALTKKIAAMRDSKGFQLSFLASNYATSGGGLASLPGSFLQPVISARIPLTAGSLGAEKHLLTLKLRKLEDDANQLEDEIGSEVAESRIRYESRMGAVTAAKERASLATQYRQAVEARHNAGLEPPEVLNQAIALEAQSRLTLVVAQVEGRSGYSMLLSICGVRNVPRAGESILATGEEEHN